MENLAVREALVTHVPTIGIVDTNADPSVLDYPIPANDDAVGSIKLIVSYIIDAWIEGRELAKKDAVSHEKHEPELAKDTKDKELTKDAKEEELAKDAKEMNAKDVKVKSRKTRKKKE